MAGAGVGTAASGLISGSHIKPGTITGKQIKNHSITLNKLSGKLPAGPRGATGAQGPAGPFETQLGAGQTLTGVYSAEGSGSFIATQISSAFPLVSAPTVVVVPHTGVNPNPTQCSGSTAAPTAAHGYLCLYEGYNFNASPLYPSDLSGNRNSSTRYGIALEVQNSGVGTVVESGTWAVTG